MSDTISASGAAKDNLPEDKEVKDIEGKGKEGEKKNVPAKGSERWEEIYHQNKESDRKIDELNLVINDIRKHNSDLSEIVKAVVAKDDTKEDDNKNVLKELKIERVKAMKDLDWEKVADIEDKIDDVKKHMEKPIVSPIIDIDSKVAAAADYSADVKLIQQFVTDVGWMNKNSKEYDEVMADAAKSMDKRLSENWNGTTSERLKEVKNRIEKRFNVIDGRKFPSVGESGSGEGGREVVMSTELSDDEKRVIRNLFPDDPKGEEKYLVQKKVIAQRRRGK